jgi:hypothetical protein
MASCGGKAIGEVRAPVMQGSWRMMGDDGKNDGGICCIEFRPPRSVCNPLQTFPCSYFLEAKYVHTFRKICLNRISRMHLPGAISLHGFLFILEVFCFTFPTGVIPLERFRGVCVDGIPRKELPGGISLHGFHFITGCILLHGSRRSDSAAAIYHFLMGCFCLSVLTRHQFFVIPWSNFASIISTDLLHAMS